MTPGRYILLTVSDTGQGMDSETIGMVFDPFFTTKEVGSGTGLGLSTVYGIVKQSKGHIGIHSEIGRGTILSLYFPAAEGDDPSDPGEAVRIREIKGDETLLVVEDEPEAREILRRNLERDGWGVLEAEHGEAALRLLATERPAAILLDLMMPVMDGFEFLAEYCQLAEWLSIPVIVLTAKEPTPEELQQLDGLVVRVLRKGHYTLDELLREIHRRVDEHIKPKVSEDTLQ